MYSFQTHASSSESLTSDARKARTSKETGEAETKSVGSGSNSTTVSDSTSPHTPENSFNDVAVPAPTENSNKGNTQQLDVPTIAIVTPEDPTPVPDIIVDAEDSIEDRRDATDEDITFAPAEEVHAGSSLAVQSLALSLPLETIYEVDSVAGSQTGLSAFPSVASRCHSRDEGATAVPMDEVESSQESQPSGGATQTPHRRTSDDMLGVQSVDPTSTERHADQSFSSLADSTLEDTSYGSLADSASRSSDVFPAQDQEGSISLDRDASFPIVSTEKNSASFGSTEPRAQAPIDAPFTLPATTGKTGIHKDQLDVSVSFEDLSHSRSMSDISGVDYFSAEEGPSVCVIEAILDPDIRTPGLDAAHGLGDINRALISLPPNDPSTSLFACDSSVLATSTPASHSCVLPPDDELHLSGGMGSHSGRMSGLSPNRADVASNNYTGSPPDEHDVVTGSRRDFCAVGVSAPGSPCHAEPRLHDEMAPVSDKDYSLPTYASGYVKSVFTVMGPSVRKQTPLSFLATLPPILKLHAANHTVFLTQPSSATPSSVNSLSSTCYADDVD